MQLSGCRHTTKTPAACERQQGEDTCPGSSAYWQATHVTKSQLLLVRCPYLGSKAKKENQPHFSRLSLSNGVGCSHQKTRAPPVWLLGLVFFCHPSSKISYQRRRGGEREETQKQPMTPISFQFLLAHELLIGIPFWQLAQNSWKKKTKQKKVGKPTLSEPMKRLLETSSFQVLPFLIPVHQMPCPTLLAIPGLDWCQQPQC